LINDVRVADNLAPSKYVKIIRTWQSGDAITIQLPMDVRIRRWQANHDSLSVDRGPLTYSLKIGEELVACDAIATAAQDSQWRQDVDIAKWPAFEILPTSNWNYGLMLDKDNPNRSFTVHQKEWPQDNFPFTAKDSPISITSRARRIPDWKLDLTGLCGQLQDSPVYSDEPTETVELIPMGAARLRLSAFPEVRDDKNLRTWHANEPKGIDYKAAASFCHSADSVSALNDGREPCASNDRGIKRLSFLPHLGTEEWIQADFTEPQTVAQVAIYWCDDESRYDHAPTGIFTNQARGDMCRTPESWQLHYLKDRHWQAVESSNDLGVEPNQFNRIEFSPITTMSLRIRVQLREKHSAGVLEWQVGAASEN
jgi:hypothetical protein